jgi:hypothetical protein
LRLLSGNQSKLLELQDDLMRTVVDLDIFGFDAKLGVCGRFIWV